MLQISIGVIMKKNILLVVVFVLAFSILLSHDQEDSPVHQRIVIEAYKLLKLQLSKEENGFADMDQYIGEAVLQDIYYWYNVTTVAGGSDHEDFRDIVWDYFGVPIDINGYGSHTSITHFWDADHPGGLMQLKKL